MQSLEKLLRNTQAQHPLIHCITNPISICQCANGVLALGGRPIMAEHPREVRQITATADALVLNLGNITDVRMKAMTIAAEEAEKKEIPVLLDAVGVACSQLRRDFALELMDRFTPAVVKGNYGEILSLYRESYRSPGVDADPALSREAVETAARALALGYGCVVLASGKADILTDGKSLVRVKNGTPQLACVTGTGCMLGAVCGTFLAVRRDMQAAVAACCMLGICGELAQTDRGSGSFLANLLDALSTQRELDRYINKEEIVFEEA